MRLRRAALAAAAVAALAGGGAAVAASGGGDEAKRAEDAVLADAAKRLGVSGDELRKALAEARDAQLERAVREGRLTEEQAQRIRDHRRASGHVLGGPGGRGHRGRGVHFGRGGPGRVLDAVAKELGISTAKLREELREGRTLEAVAERRGRSRAQIERVVKAALERELDRAVEDERITERQAGHLREHLDERVDHLLDGPRHGPGLGPPPGPPGP